MKVILRTLCGCERVADIGGSNERTPRPSIDIAISEPMPVHFHVSDIPETSPYKIRTFELVRMSHNIFTYPMYIEKWR